MKKKSQSIRGISLTAIAKRLQIPIQRVYNHRSYKGRTGLTDEQVYEFNRQISEVCDRKIETIDDFFEFMMDDRVQGKNIIFKGKDPVREWPYKQFGVFKRHILSWMFELREWQEETKKELLKPKPKKD